MTFRAFTVADLADHESLRANYERDGFLVVTGFTDRAKCAELRRAIAGLVTDWTPDTGSAVFSTTDNRHASDRYFLESGGAVRFFLEEEAVDADGSLATAPTRALNKIGHALHDRIPAFDRFSRDPRLASLCTTLGVSDPRLVQSMVIFKQPHIGGEVTWHQDATFLHTDPITVTGFWFALEDADRDNGCMWALPGWHRSGLGARFVRGEAGMHFETVTPGLAWPSGLDESSGEAVPLEVPAGTLVVLHGLLPHFSAPNRTARSRQAYALHVVSNDADWSQDNWLVRAADDPPRGF